MQLPVATVVRLGVREIAQEIERSDEKRAAEIFSRLEHKKARRVIRNLSDEAVEKLAGALGPKRFADFLAHMKDHDAVKVLRRLSRELRTEIMAALPKREKTVYGFLLRFSKDVAGDGSAQMSYE
ncbi:MAG: hypothetical protein PWP76_65 [Candidatus Diapherotrites archaeon]|nr:hypothetical protein [Candidatus Diapherotrites archaeon]MDN5366956.1 hypothetical protein [Candidatus Diapherotrites archaeon]